MGKLFVKQNLTFCQFNNLELQIFLFYHDKEVDIMKLIELEEVDSTNDYLKREYKNLPMQACVTTKHQTKGRGRNGHVWQSHPNENLIMSFYLKIS